ncbi:unnamed protein product, partial [Prorocentrum cordatum]
GPREALLAAGAAERLAALAAAGAPRGAAAAAHHRGPPDGVVTAPRGFVHGESCSALVYAVALEASGFEVRPGQRWRRSRRGVFPRRAPATRRGRWRRGGVPRGRALWCCHGAEAVGAPCPSAGKRGESKRGESKRGENSV